MLTTISSQMDEIEVITILKRYKDKKTERERERKRRVIKSPAFLFSTAIWPYLAHSRSGLNYMCKAKHKTLENA